MFAPTTLPPVPSDMDNTTFWRMYRPLYKAYARDHAMPGAAPTDTAAFAARAVSRVLNAGPAGSALRMAAWLAVDGALLAEHGVAVPPACQDNVQAEPAPTRAPIVLATLGQGPDPTQRRSAAGKKQRKPTRAPIVLAALGQGPDPTQRRLATSKKQRKPTAKKQPSGGVRRAQWSEEDSELLLRLARARVNRSWAEVMRAFGPDQTQRTVRTRSGVLNQYKRLMAVCLPPVAVAAGPAVAVGPCHLASAAGPAAAAGFDPDSDDDDTLVMVEEADGEDGVSE